MNRARPTRGTRAFTLIEILGVVVLICILAVLVVPRGGIAPDQTLQSAALMLAADIEFAESESAAHPDAPRALTVVSTTTYQIATSATPNTAITNPVDQQSYVVTYGLRRAGGLAGVTISSYSLGGDNVVVFGRYGQLDQVTQAKITLMSGSKHIDVNIDPNSGETSTSSVY